MFFVSFEREMVRQSETERRISDRNNNFSRLFRGIRIGKGRGETFSRKQKHVSGSRRTRSSHDKCNFNYAHAASTLMNAAGDQFKTNFPHRLLFQFGERVALQCSSSVAFLLFPFRLFLFLSERLHQPTYDRQPFPAHLLVQIIISRVDRGRRRRLKPATRAKKN